ncbi:MAG: radical SAM protein [Nanoarchaeota archaeon]|nr:radical SAM protein [Nanoarchaeota archaeon]
MVLSLQDRVKQVSNLYSEEQNGMSLIIEPYNANWAVIDQDTKRILNQLTQSRTIGELRSKDGGNIEQTLTILFDAGLIEVNGQKNQSKSIIQCNLEKSLQLIIFQVTNACNLRCKYCYTDAGSGAKISEEILKKTLSLGICPPRDRIEFQFHGGEPLLAYDRVRNAVDYGYGLAEKRGISVRFSLQTNLVELTEDMVKFFKTNKIHIGTSLDGPKKYHDQNRIFRKGKGSFDVVTEKLGLLKKHELSFGVLCVVSDINVLDGISDFMIEYAIPSMKLNPYFNQGRAIKEESNQAHQEAYAEKEIALMHRIINHNKAHPDNRLKLNHLANMIKNIISRDRNYMCQRNPCGAGLSMLGVGYDGKIYPCHEMIGKNDLVIGNVLEISSFEEIFDDSETLETLRSRTTETIGECSSCEIKQFCGGGCANKAHNSGNLFNRFEYCTYNKIMYKNLFWELYKDPEGVLALI